MIVCVCESPNLGRSAWLSCCQDYVEKPGDVSAVGTLVEVKDPKALRARQASALWFPLGTECHCPSAHKHGT